MPFPDTLPALAEAGYVHSGSGKCSACGMHLEWFLTPKNQKMPMSRKQEIMVGQFGMFALQAETRYEPHWASCPAAGRFRRKKR